MPLLNPEQLKKTVVDLLKDEDSDQEGDNPPPGAAARSRGSPLTPATMRNTLRNKTLKLGTAFLGLWGLDDVAKPRWRYLEGGQPLPDEPGLILRVGGSPGHQGVQMRKGEDGRRL